MENKSFSFQKQSGEQSPLCFLRRLELCGAVVCGSAATATKRCLKNFSFIVLFGDEEEGSGWQSQQKKQKYVLHPVSALTPPTPAPLFFSGRADNACTNLLGFFVRYVRTRGIVEVAESGKTADFCFILRRTHLPRTTSCD